MAKEIKEEITQIKGMGIKDWQVLVDLEESPYWEVLHNLFKTKMYNLMVSIARIPAEDPNLSTKKAFYDGEIQALRAIDNQVQNARKELEKLAQRKEK